MTAFSTNSHEKLAVCRYQLITLVLVRLGRDAALRVGKLLRDPRTVHLERITPVDENEAWTLFSARADKVNSFTDCTSFVIMRRLRINQALTLDTHFAHEQFIVAPRL